MRLGRFSEPLGHALVSGIGLHGRGELLGDDACKSHKEVAYGFGWVGGVGGDSCRVQFVAVTQSPSS